jgi:hypothetical protein
MSTATARAVDAPENRIIFALDCPGLAETRAGAQTARGTVGGGSSSSHARASS